MLRGLKTKYHASYHHPALLVTPTIVLYIILYGEIVNDIYLAAITYIGLYNYNISRINISTETYTVKPYQSDTSIIQHSL